MCDGNVTRLWEPRDTETVAVPKAQISVLARVSDVLVLPRYSSCYSSKYCEMYFVHVSSTYTKMIWEAKSGDRRVSRKASARRYFLLFFQRLSNVITTTIPSHGIATKSVQIRRHLINLWLFLPSLFLSYLFDTSRKKLTSIVLHNIRRYSYNLAEQKKTA